MIKNGQNEFVISNNSKVSIKVIKSLCIGAATCVILAPETFDLDDEGIAYVKNGTWEDAKTIIKAAKSCPTMAIIVEDLAGNQIYPEVKSD